MKFAVITLFPEIIKSYFDYGVVGRAVKNNIVELLYFNPRDYSDCKHGNVDDTPFGGGAGMVMKPEPIVRAIEAAKERLSYHDISQGLSCKPIVIYLTPQGEQYSQSISRRLLEGYQANNLEEKTISQPIILLCGRYEGIDERVISSYVDYEYSIGDYILSGGELASLVVLDSVIRLLPGVLGDNDSAANDSFSDSLNGCLEYPHYTKPVEFNNIKVPDVLRSGNHQEIAQWRKKQSLGRTWLRRPNLLKYLNLTENESLLLEEFKTDFKTDFKKIKYQTDK